MIVICGARPSIATHSHARSSWIGGARASPAHRLAQTAMAGPRIPGFATMDERFSTLVLRVEHFENRVMAAVREVRDQVAVLAGRIDLLAGQVEELNTRVEGQLAA